MRLISYRTNQGAGVGVMVDDSNFVALAEVASDLPTTLRGLLELDDGLTRLAEATEGKAATHGMDDVTLDPVIPDADTIWCAALNYSAHQAEVGRTRSEYPEIFLRTQASVVGHMQPVVAPYGDGVTRYDFEGELVAIIGKAGRHVKAADYASIIAGYSIYNDGSVRDWQNHTIQWTAGKNFPGTGGFGPFMMTADELGDPTQLELTTRLNGTVLQNTTTDLLIFDIPTLIEYITTFTELRPGDVISTGTPGGVGFKRDPQIFMKDGDTVEVEISKLGTLVNPIVAE